jgi:hypothetical protein
MTSSMKLVPHLVVLLSFSLVVACGEDTKKRATFSSNMSNNTANNSSNNATNNVVDPAKCGNGEVDTGESCDHLIESGDGACPDACDEAPMCFTSVLAGDPLGCTARCIATPVTCSMISDGCCSLGCSAATDSDCTNTCGNGIVETGEACDGNCPDSCNDNNVCTRDTVTGSAATCSAQCTYTANATCQSGDGCCPSGCTTANDNDCSSTCGNGVVDASETCDGNCPDSCNDNNVCTRDTVTGSAATCSAQCTYTNITSCQGGDGCCPVGCTAQVDNDCVCNPTTSCAAQGLNCGTIFNGCANVACGTCGNNQSCQNNVCVNSTPTAMVGQACSTTAGCPLGPFAVCYTAAFGFPGGYCTIDCSANRGTCTGDSVCINAGGVGDVCADTCGSNADCRSGYTCQDALGDGTLVCAP